ncbi:RHS repeat-associated core domain-containing protein [Pseudoalteromonas tunicata]|jgi:RHS repeat-associated protein|uniref:Rhs family protein n=1 Tax=Pseudoalteromonas tunicata D2 TaxID=87626 RepID=A4C4V9_9GAMM|nr:RHS repeat-associated core domain-containing protein [Pseudoalteromonas tunicata]ATC96931.1 hypothetical protein PTUN_b0567 [Pseudoalteromonas tunicata]EAR30591.1 Rhs family protein [Pseudoalteromonas tunicata D2]
MSFFFLYKEDCSEVAGKVTIDKTTYLGNYEKNEHITDDKTVIEHKYYIGDIIVTQRSDNTTDTFYLHKDHQGSVIATTTTNQQDQAEVVSQAMYDPFGKRTSVYLAAKFDVFTYSQPTDRGYTGHKMLSALDIIHMNGRIYDPTLGRFLQADPFIQAPGNSQSYNRYSYVLNNPLSYTDPSGYFLKKLWQTTTGTVLRAIAKVPILNSIITVGLNFIPGCQGWCSAVYTAASTYAVTGNLTGALKAGAISYLSAQALQGVGGSEYWGDAGSIQNVAANAMIGGISTELQGGKFGHGFFSAGINAAFKPSINNIGGENSANSAVARGDTAALNLYKVHRAIAAGAIGGTASVVSGGKFANGAVTGAFTQMFNNETNNHRKATHKYIEILIDRGDSASKQQAINLTVTHFGIDLGHKGKFNYPTYDPTLDSDGQINNGILIGDGAFRSVGFLASTIYHEMQHIRMGSVTGDEFQGETLSNMEVRAYDAELQNSNRFGLSGSELLDIRGRRSAHCMSISSATRGEFGISC